MARARLIETLGFDGIWVGDTIGRAATARPDVLAWLAVAAAGTEHIELGTAVIQVPLRHPVELAQRLSTLHAITGGRFVAGLGAGSTRADFDAVGVDYAQRFRIFAEAVPVIRQLCDGAQVGAANLRPWPQAAGGPPMLIGSWESGLWVRRAAREYDGWQGSGLTTLKALTEGIKRFRDAGGKRAMVNTIDVDLHLPNQKLGDDERFTLRCGPEEAADRLNALAELGYDDACLTRQGHSEADITEEDLILIRSLVPQQQARVR
jgi:alkanesulfonate monooxygenase SsuD/methylene tetrahydromethanopterin reductase-like flavin-dependent oxidoreductase (luciferase family)